MNPNISKVLCCWLSMSVPFGLFAETAEEVIAKHIEAHGGAVPWSRVETMKVTGKFTAFSLEKDFMCYKTQEGSYYADFYLGEKPVIESIHKGAGWTIDPWQDMDYARRLNSGEVNALMQKAEFFSPFLYYRERGYLVDYPGIDTVDGMPMHVLKLTRTNGKTETWYINANTYLEYKCESDWVDFAQTVPAETYFDDFREVEGLTLPFFVERTFWQRDRILLVEEVEINPGLDEHLFDMPRRPEMDRLSFLEGNWDVTVEAWTRRGTWYNMGTTTSAFEFASANLIQEKITYERLYLITKVRSYAFHGAAGKYRVTEYNDLTTDLVIYEGVLSDTSFVFDDTGGRTGNGEVEGAELTRYLISLDTRDGFIMERLASADGGETWGPKDRFTYTRKIIK